MHQYNEPLPVKKQAKSGERILLGKISSQLEALTTALSVSFKSQTETLTKRDPNAVQKVEVLNQATIKTEKVEFPELQKVEVTNFQKAQALPIYSGKNTNPDSYMAVRLFDGERFYKALDEWFVSASGGSKSGSSSSIPMMPLSGQKKVASTGVAVAISATPLTGSGFIVQALAQNAGNVYIGPFGVTTTADGTGNGFELQPGQALGIAVQDLHNLFVNGTAGDGICFIGS